MKRIQLPLILLVIVGLLYAGYKLFMPSPVSATELEMMVESAGSTQYLTVVQRQDNQRMFANLKNLVVMNNNRERDVQLLDKVQGIMSLTQQVLDKSQKVRLEAIASVGGTPEQVTGRNKKVSIDDQKLLEVIFLVKNYSDTVSAIAEQDFPTLLKDPEGTELNSYQYFNTYFKDKSLAVFLINLSRMENELANLERKAMEAAGSIANYVDIAFDSIVPIVNVANKRVEEGDIYEAEISFGALDPNIRYYMTIDNKAVPSEAGVGVLQLDPAEYKDNSFRAAITLVTPFGNTTYGATHEFSVEKN